MNWDFFFPKESEPIAIISATKKPDPGDFENGILMKKSHFIRLQQVASIEDYKKNCQIDTSFFVRCYCNTVGGCLHLIFIDAGSMAITRCCAWKCYSNELTNFLFSSFDKRNFSSTNIYMNSICDCSNEKVQEVLHIISSSTYVSNLNHSFCQTKNHCAPIVDYSNSKLSFLNIISNVACTVILGITGNSLITMSNILNNTETKTTAYELYNGTICTRLNSIINFLNCYIESGNSYLACSKEGKITFAQCHLDHCNVKFGAAVFFINSMNIIEMTLLSTHAIIAKIPYKYNICSKQVNNHILKQSIMLFFFSTI